MVFVRVRLPLVTMSIMMASLILMGAVIPRARAFSSLPSSNNGAVAAAASRRSQITEVSLNAEVPKTNSIFGRSSGFDKPTYGEESRQYRRTVYAHEDWIKHRQSDRFLKNLLSTIDSGVVRGTKLEVSIVTAIATSVVVWNGLFYEGFRDFAGVLHDPVIALGAPLTLPSFPFTISISALSLLVTFRTNNAYQRWFEARQCWGIINTECRNVARIAGSWCVPEKEPNREKRVEDIQRVSTGAWVFMRALQRHTGGPGDEEDFQKTVREALPKEEAEGLIAAGHRPMRALFNLSRHIERLPLNERQRIEVDKSCVIIGDICGACERIYGTPIPLVYTRHTSRFLCTWLFLLPLAMWEPFGNSWNHWTMVPSAAVVSLFLFGVDELSIQLEEPFSVLPISGLVNGVKNLVNSVPEWHQEYAEPVEGMPRELTYAQATSSEKVQKIYPRSFD
mmetsp:Transcript_128/g.238  ORF Transcript_128/g.238 Transcript_128/m.238 type:complete len:450 (+) Transcript_128:104-1453(+)